MSGKKQESWKDFFKKSATTNRSYQSDQVTDFQPGVTTSASQIQKASEGLSSNFDQVINQTSKEQQKLDNFKVARATAIEEKKVKKEATLKVEPGSLDEEVKKGLNNDQAFLTFKSKEEEREQLADKSLWNRFKTSIARQGLIPGTVGGPASALANLLFSDEEIAQSFTKPGVLDKGRTEKEQKRFDALNKEYENTIKPYIKKYDEKNDKELLKRKELIKGIDAQLDEYHPEVNPVLGRLSQVTGIPRTEVEVLKRTSFSDYFSSLFSEEGKNQSLEQSTIQTKQEAIRKLYKDKAHYEMGVTQREKMGAKMKDFVNGSSSALWGVSNHWRDFSTVGLHGLVTDLNLYKITQKKETERTDAEKDALLAYGENVELEKKDLFKDRYWYRAGDGAGSSIVFMESTLLTEGAGGAVKSAVQSSLKGSLKKVLSTTVKGSLKRKLGVGLTQKIVPATAGLAAQGLVSPTTYASMLKQKIGDVRVIEDKDGNKRVVTSDASYKQFMKEYDLNRKSLEYFINDLRKKEKLSPQEQAELDKYEDNLRDLNSEKELLRPKSWAESFAYGYTETLKEFASEKYVGALGDKGVKWLAKSKLGKFTASINPLQKSFKAAKEFTDWGQNYINNTTVGKISSKALYHTGANKLYNGLPGEIIEEIAVQATPTFRTENFIEEYKNQLRELKEPTFYADIVGQTLVMSGGTTTLGTLGSAVNYRKRKQFYNERVSLREAYKAIDKAVTDEDLAETILMASGGTVFSQVDYDHKIQSLREKGTEEANKTADAIEQKKFVNMAVKAIQTNTLDEFEQTLDALSKRKDSQFSEATAVNIGLAKQKITEIKKVYETYGQRSNVGEIVDLAVQKMTAKQSIAQLEGEILSQKNLANEAYQDYLQSLGKNAPAMSVPGDIDSLLDSEGTTPEEESELDKFTKALEETNNPAIQTYVNLLAARDNMQAARRMTMKNFNEAVSPQYEADLQKTKAVARQFQKSVRYIEENNITDAGIELDASGKAILSDSFIDQAFMKIDTMGLPKEKVNKMKEDLKRFSQIQARQRQAGSFDRIAMLHEYAKSISQEKLDKETPEVQNPYQVEEIDNGTLFNRFQVKNTQDSNAESFTFDTKEEAETKIAELNEVQEASAEEVATYERELETVKQGLYHPIALESEVVTDEYFDNVDNAAPVLLDEFHKTGKVSSETVENLFDLTPGVVSETLSKVITDSLSAPPVVTINEDVVESLGESIQELQSELDNIMGTSQSSSVTLESTTETPDTIDVDNDSLDTLDPLSFLPIEREFGPEEIKNLAAFAKKTVKTIKDSTGQDPTFKDFVYYYVRFSGKEKAEQSFDAYKVAWEAANLAPTNYQEVYNEIFEPLKDVFKESQAYIDSLLNITPTTVSTLEQVQQGETQELAKVEQAEVKTMSFNEENVPVKTSNNRRIAGPALRLGFNAIKYEEVEVLDASGKGTGSFVRVPVLTDTLNYTEGPVDFRELLDPDKYNPGDTINVAMVPESEWANIRVYVGRDTENKPITKPYSEIYQEKLAANPDFRTSQEFLNTVPVVAYNNQGQPVAYIHETSWYNAWNVSDPSRKDNSIDPTNISMSHKQAIDEAQKTISNFRVAVVNGGINKITITEKSEGAFYTIGDKVNEQGKRVDLISINEANPQSIIAIQGNQAVLETGVNVPFENGKRVILNKDLIFQKGNRGKVWQLRRIGVDSEGRETWRVFFTTDYKNIADMGKTPAAEIETVKWAWSAYSFFDTRVDEKKGTVIQDVRKKHVVGTPYDLTEVQAREMIKQIKEITGYNLMRFEDADAFFSLFFHPKTGNSRAEFGRQVYTASDKSFYLNVSRDGLGKDVMVPMISNGVVTSTNKTYQEYIKDKLTTAVRSFNIGTAENPNYVTSIQPSITFEYQVGEVEEETPDVVIENNTAELIASTQLLKQSELTAEQLIEEAKKLQQDLGFKDTNLLALPSTMENVEALKNIFNLTPGLDIAQEAHLIDFIYNFINTAIDVKYNSKVSKEKLLKEVANSYNEIVSPSREKVRVLLDKLTEANQKQTNPEIRESIASLRNMLRTLDNIESNWNISNIKAVLELTGESYSGQVGIIEKAMEEVSKTSDIKEKQDDLEEEASEEDVTMKVKSFEDNASLTESGKSKTSYRLRRFMSGIKRVNADGTVIKGFLGLPSYVNYNEVYDTLYQLLGSGVYIESNFETMKAKILEMKNAQPWVVELMEKFDKADAQLRNELVVNYRKHAVAMKFTMFTENSTGSRLQVYDTNANEVTRVIIKEWENNFKTSPLVLTLSGQYAIDKKVAQALLDEYNSWNREGFNQDDKVVRDWLGSFGIELSDGYWNELKQIGFTYQNKSIPYNQSFEGNNVPIGLLAKYLQSVLAIQDEKNLNFEENEKAHPFKDMQAVLKAVAKGESRYSGKILSKNFRDGGKNISGITNPTFITDRIDDLIRSVSSGNTDLIDTLKSISISSNSVLLELLQKEPDFYKKLEANYLGITAIKEYGKESGMFSSITDLNSLDHDTTKLGMFQDMQQGKIAHRIGDFSLRVGRMFLPTMSDKSQMLSIATGVFNFMSESDIAFTRDEEGNIKFTPELRDLLYQKLVLPEMKRISNFHKNVKATDIKDYDKAAQLFNFFPALNMLKDESGDRIVQHLVTQSVESVEKLFKEQLIDVVENTMHSIAQEKSELLSTFKEFNDDGKIKNIKFFDTKYLNTGKGSLEEKFEVANYDFVLNSVLANADMFTVIAGDPALYSQDKLFKGVDQPYFASNDDFYRNLSEKQGVNIGKRLALLVAPGRSLAESSNKTYKQIFLKDAVDITENAEYLITLFEGEKALSQPIYENSNFTVKEALDEYKTANDTRKAVLRKALKDKFADIEKLGDYFDIESTDAQEYTTLKEHLYVLFHDGKLPEDKYKDLLDKADKGIRLSKEDLGLVLQPVKPVYTGQIFDKDEEGNVKGDVARVVYIKSSSFPLIPELTAGTKLDDLRKTLESLEKKYDTTVRASYQTANKVGAKVDSQTIDPLNTESLKGIETAMLTLNRKDFRIQQDVPFKSDLKKEDKIAMGTQIFKLLFGDGVMDLKGFSFNGKEGMSGRELYDEYNKVFTALVQSKKQGLFAELGLNELGVAIDEKQTMLKLQNLLQKEAINRDYPIQDIRSLGLETLEDKEGNTYFDFKTPLWLTTNSDRFESLLNAIVTNRLMTHKMPGNSFVAASENGFAFKDNLEGISESRVIYFDNFNGVELQGAGKNADGTYRKAQVLAPSKFKDKEGKLIDLFTKVNGDFLYIERRENGTWKLKDGMIEPELLNQFTFRIPTSSHVSASSIEIVGILPPEVGDLIVTPKNFTKQMGQDFDVDKLNTYQLHHIVDFKTGKVEVLNDKHKEKATSKLRKLLEDLDLEKIKLQRQMLPEEVIEFLGKFGREEKIDLAEYFDKTLLEEVIAEETSVQNKFDALERKFNEKLLENDFIKLHTSVFNNPSPEMQGKINKVLSMDFARQQAGLIQDLTSEGQKFETTQKLQQEGLNPTEAQAVVPFTNTAFTILSDEYQKKKMGLGSAGKMAIGIYSNYVTFHSLVQQTPQSLNLREEGEEGMVNKDITIGGLTSSGRLGNLRTLDNSRSIAEVFAERQNTATDNEKEQILGRVNINSLTIGVDSLLTLLGFDKVDSTQGPLSVSYALLSQPILKDYVEMMQKGKGVTAAFNPSLEETVINDLINKYKGDLTEEQLAEVTGEELSGDNLVQGLTTKGSNPKTQIAALQTFLDLNTYAKNVAKVQSVLFTANLGKSIVESNLAFDSLGTFSENKLVSNVSTLIGDFVAINEDFPVSEGYSIVGNYYVKPTTPQGQIVVEGLNTAQLLWSDFFPYNDPSLKSIIDSIMKISGNEDASKYKTIDSTLGILKEVKKYVYSWKGLGLYTESTFNERKRLFMSNGTNTSLAEYLNSKSRIPELMNNKLLNRFSYEIELDGRPSLIKYNNTISDNLEEKYLYNSLAELMLEDKPLPDWNGKPFSTRQLAQELITYSYLEGGVQQAIQFIKYVPVEYLSQVGVRTPQGFISAASMLQKINTKRDPAVFNRLLGTPSETTVETSPFIRQFFQHNPDQAPSFSEEFRKQKFAFDKTGDTFILNAEESPKFISIRNKTSSKLKQEKFSLYEHAGNNTYKRLSVLGAHGMNEYQAGVTNSVSIMEKKAPAPVNQNVGPKQQTNNPVKEFGSIFDAGLGTVQDNSSAADVLKAIANSSTTKSARYKALANALLPFASVNTKVTVGDPKTVLGVTSAGVYDPNTDSIVIHSKLSSEKKEGVFIHELVHALTLKDLKKYYEIDTDGFFTILKGDAPDHVRQLDAVWKLYIENTDPQIREAAKQKTLDLRAKKPVVFSTQEREIGYPSVDIFEFLAVAMESEDFQKHLNSIQLPGGQTLLDKFLEAIKTILTEIGVEVKKGSLAEKSLNDILNFMQVEAEIKQENATFATIELDSDSLEQELYERAMMEQETTEQQFEEDAQTNIDQVAEGDPEASLLPAIESVESLRRQEQEELRTLLPNALITDDKIERENLTNAKDKAIFDKVYKKYDKLISPLLQQQGDLLEKTNLTLEEWNSLSSQEKQKIKECN